VSKDARANVGQVCSSTLLALEPLRRGDRLADQLTRCVGDVVGVDAEGG
jgi:hypothetical protein